MRIFFLIISIFCLVPTVFGQRISQTINTGWNFTLAQSSSPAEIVNIPHTWNAGDAFTDRGDYFRGEGIYSKELYIPNEWNSKKIFIKCEGANQVVKVWVNGSLAGSHTGGYTAFALDITSQVKFGENNAIKISCDNSHNANIPPLSADFTFYGGIYRDVCLIATNIVHFDMVSLSVGKFRIETPQVSEKEATISISANICNESKSSQKYVVHTSIFDNSGKEVKTTSREIKLKEDNTKFNTIFQINDPQLWSPESPNLYTAKLTIENKSTGETIDSQSSTFGCRWFAVDPEKGFFLNGKSYKLMGVNRHQDYKGLGNALSNAFHELDIKNIKAMGSNFIRIAHYPQDPDIYDWCDKMGLIAWSEIPIVNQITPSQEFSNNVLQMQREHIEQNFNHPSVFMWGYMNEVLLRPPFNNKTTEREKEEYFSATLQLAKELNAETKNIDPNRLTVMALHGNQIYNTTKIADVPDIIGWNLYMGWYGGKINDLGKFLDNEHKNHPTRPILISEYGPGADIRLQTDNPQAWDFSEAYQIKLHHSYVNQVEERPFVMGMAAWNYADFGSAGRVDAIPNLNQKGLLTFDRDTKDIYHYYQARLLTKPFLFIGGKHRSAYFTDSLGTIYVPIYSNQPNVDLFIDENKIEEPIEIEKGLGYARLQLPEGKHELKIYNNGNHHIREINVVYRTNMMDRISQQPILVNIGSYCDFTDERTKETWIADQPYSVNQWGYIGGSTYQKNPSRTQGTDSNILGTDNDPLFQTMRKNIDAYKFDVVEGTYRISLLFAEPNSKASTKSIYDLGENIDQKENGTRVFSISINGNVVNPSLNIAGEYGINQAIEMGYEIHTKKGIEIKLDSIENETIISAIKIERIN